MSTTYILGVVAIFRKCRVCDQWFKLGKNRRARTCSDCRGLVGNTCRAYRITKAGYRALREAEAESA